MKNFKKFAIMIAVVFSLATVSVSVFAKGSDDVVASLAKITNKTVEEVVALKNENNKSYGEIAKDAGKLEEFKLERTKLFKERLAEKVADEKITQEKADEILERRIQNMENCDGKGTGEGLRLNLNRQAEESNDDGHGQGHRQGEGQRLQKQDCNLDN